MADAPAAIEVTGADIICAPRFQLPIDVVLALPASPRVRELIQARRNAGEWPRPVATIYAWGRRYMAVVDFEGPGATGLMFPLDVYVWERLG